MLLNRLNNLNIRSKLFFFLAVPVLTLLYFSISGINLKYEEQFHTKRSLDSISLSLILADLVHELQKERGLSAGFVGSKGTLHSLALSEQRILTDEKLQQIAVGLERGDQSQLSLDIHELLGRLQYKLDQLPVIRSAIDSLNKGDFFDDYSEINTTCLDINKHLQTRIKDSKLSRHNDAYNTLLWLQERSGQERGLLNGIFSVGKLKADQFKALSAYSTDQQTLIAHFYTVATHEQKSLLEEKFMHPVIAEVSSFQTAVINKAMKNDFLNGIQILIGYGGLIHNFKNYVIRGQQPYVENYNDLYVRAVDIIDRYRKLPGMSQKEIEALRTIEATFLKYKRLFNTTKRLRDKGSNIAKIDSIVKVDDSGALEAIQYLHNSVTGLDTSVWWEKATERIQLIKEVSDTIRSDMLSQVKKISDTTTRSLYIYLILTIGSLLLTALLGYLLIQRLVGGIINIEKHISSMQKQGDFARAIDVTGNDEISKVAKAFNRLIDERKKSEEKLMLAASVLNSTNEAITVTDANRRITMVNPAFSKITGYSQQEVIGKNPSFLQSGRHDSHFYKEMWDTLLQEGHWIGEIYNRRKNGEIYPEMLNISAIKNDQGKVIMYIGMFLDITKHKQAEEKQDYLQRQLLQAQKMEALGQLTGGIAHDFNNILGVILGYTSLAEDLVSEKHSDEKLQGYLTEISLAGDRAKQVVSQMLAYSRSGKETELQTTDVESLLNESIKMIGPLLPSTIELTTRFTPYKLKILVNPVMIHQVIMNLCINARDAIVEHGRIEFSVQTLSLNNEVCSSCHKPITGEFIEVSISDSGAGIDANNIAHLFDPFFTTKDMGSEKGTGMGLAMVHGIMHEHKGHIIVESDMGKGSKFRLLFAMNKTIDQLEAKNTEARNIIQPGIDKVTDSSNVYNILCVDDEASLVALMKEILEEQGHRVSIFTDSNEALLCFKENPTQYDLVITDQTMPKLTGSEMSKAILEIQSDMPIILCSGYSENIDREGARAIGISAYMDKPVNMKKLFEVIDQLDIHL